MGLYALSERDDYTVPALIDYLISDRISGDSPPCIGILCCFGYALILVPNRLSGARFLSVITGNGLNLVRWRRTTVTDDLSARYQRSTCGQC